MADIASLVKALKDKAVAQYEKGAPYRQALASALKGDTQGINQALSKSDLTPMDFALMMGVNPIGKFKYDAISHELPLIETGKETSPFIGYITKNGEHELFDANKAKQADYHHSYLVKNMDNYDLDSTLRFVRMGGENRFTLTGDSALDPYHPQSTKQIQMLSKKLQENGADPNANFLISDMALPFNEAPYQNKEIGKLSDWWSNK